MSKAKPLTKTQRQLIRDALVPFILSEDGELSAKFFRHGNFTICTVFDDDKIIAAGASKRRPVSRHKKWEQEFNIPQKGDAENPVIGEEVALSKALLLTLEDDTIRSLAKRGIVEIPKRK